MLISSIPFHGSSPYVKKFAKSCIVTSARDALMYPGDLPGIATISAPQVIKEEPGGHPEQKY